MKHRIIFWTSLSRHLLRTVGFLVVIFFMAAQIWGQSTMTMPTPSVTPTPKSMAMPTRRAEMNDMKSGSDSSMNKDMDGDKMGAPGLVPPGIMVGMKGKWMIGYQLMFDKMDGNRIGTRNVSNASVLTRYMASPTDMTMQMHMAMVMYAPTDKFTVMVMFPYVVKSMNHVAGDGTRFNERTTGIGDIEARALYTLYARKDLRHRLLLNAGVGLPTGSIDQRMAGMRLEYPMQLGSGTFSVMPGFTYLGQIKPWGWGAEFIPTLRIGRNSNGYRLGNRYQPGAWGSRTLKSWISLSARLNADIWQNVKGADAILDIMDEPTKDPRLQGGRRLDLVVGPSFHPSQLKGQEFFVHFDKPIFQSLDGPQLQRRWAIMLSWQYEF